MLIAIALAIVLAASAGLRLFMPFLFMSIGARYLNAPVPPMLSWIGTNEGFWLLLIATVIECVSDKIPIVDHVLDSIATFIKPVAGALLPIAIMWHFSPAVAWTLGIVAGAPLALGVHATKAGTRATSTVTTAGVGNPIISVFEDVLAVVLLVLAIVAPLLAAVATLILLYYVFKAIVRIRRRFSGHQ